jgi:hypothetical protein
MPRPAAPKKTSCDYHFVPLELAKRFEALAAERGVSKVARGAQASKQSQGGFFQAAKRAQGDWRKLSQMPVRPGAQQTWWQRRNAFCARHRAQQIKNREPALERTGKYAGTPTRRELGLLMWMCSSLPPAQLRKIANRTT